MYSISNELCPNNSSSIDEGTHFERVQVNRCDIKLEIFEKCKEAENEKIRPQALIFQTPPFSIKNEDGNFKA